MALLKATLGLHGSFRVSVDRSFQPILNFKNLFSIHLLFLCFENKKNSLFGCKISINHNEKIEKY